MNEERLNRAMRGIRMPEEARQRLLLRLNEERPRRVVRASKRPALAAVAACLALVLCLPAFAANVEPAYTLLYRASPAAAQYLQPVRESDEDKGIRMEVVSAAVQGDTAEVWVSLQDLTGSRVDATTDLFDSYSIRSPVDQSAHCELAGYEETTGTALFRVEIIRADGKSWQGEKITFSSKKFLSRRAAYEQVDIPLDLTRLPQNAATMAVSFSVYAGPEGERPDTFDVLVPEEGRQNFPVEGFSLTGAAWAADGLHLQLAVKNRQQNDNNGDVYLLGPDGEKNYYDFLCYFRQGEGESRVDYMEYVFSGTPQTLADCRLAGDFYTAGLLTEGSWKVTFRLEGGE
ncbi:MAG: hypothetical protein SOY27_05465 [Fournierella sp.]|uniref:hypothetical protein n=1 Tax=Allofournierella sp. TaxID=1940256 RepID=UPI002A83DCB1|nr:hypothetical protein [Fournierella sp.]MDY4166925.1 hypothetical protein [Fournierella sp.]